MRTDSLLGRLFRPAALRVNPRFARLLASQGLTTPEDFMQITGAIVSGHPDRHVMRTTIGPVSCWVKREHRVPLRDRLMSLRDGYGLDSVSMREATTLQFLAERGVAVPEWMAAGEHAGRAFLIVKDAGDATNLKQYLAHTSRSESLAVAQALGESVAHIHHCGINYPDLYAKHVLVDRSGALTFLDWQRSRSPRRLSWATRCRDLAALHASISDELADAPLRTAFLRSYLRHAGHRISARDVGRLITARTAILLRRSSIREQRLATVQESQPLFWLDGEALCVTQMGREMLGPDELIRLARPDSPEIARMLVSEDGTRPCRLTVRQTRSFWNARRQAPEVREAAALLRRERLGEPVRLLAFGQRRRSWSVRDSFLLVLAENDAEAHAC